MGAESDPASSAGAFVSLRELAPTGSPTFVIVDGRFAGLALEANSLPEGVEVRSLVDALRDGDEVVAHHLTKLAEYELNAFSALNTAFMLDGAVVRISREAVVDAPIHLVYVTTAKSVGRQVNPRALIVAERFSKATVIESYVGVDAVYFTNAVTEVVLEDGATLAHYKLQQESKTAHHVGTVETTQGRDSHYVSFSFATGSALSRTNIYTALDGDGCGATLNGLFMLDGTQHGDHQTRIEHSRPNCFSREIYKGILDGSSHGVFNGKVYVHPIAQKTDGKQTNNTLLLSDKAQIDTKPQLEIFADDVKCTHGATVGRIDETALFYMKSRGISADMARKLLTYAFAAEVLETIEVPWLRETLEAATLERFAGVGSPESGVGSRISQR
jgi:Fe-S cluster assembly protein SufD